MIFFLQIKPNIISREKIYWLINFCRWKKIVGFQHLEFESLRWKVLHAIHPCFVPEYILNTIWVIYVPKTFVIFIYLKKNELFRLLTTSLNSLYLAEKNIRVNKWVTWSRNHERLASKVEHVQLQSRRILLAASCDCD